MNKVFHGTSIEKCLQNASSELCIKIEDLKYEVIEERKGIFSNKVYISVEYEEEKRAADCEEKKSNLEDTEVSIMNENDGKIRVEDGKISVLNPKEGGKPAKVIKGKGVILEIDGKNAEYKSEVFEESNISVYFNEVQGTRNMKFRISEDNMKAFVSIVYKPAIVYKLVDKKVANEIILESEVLKEVYPTPFTKDEIKEELTKLNIVYGIIEENLSRCLKGTKEEVLIAEGTPVTQDTDDEIEIKFTIQEQTKQLEEDETGNIDFKSIGSVEAVKKGDIIAVKVDGVEGSDGIDIHNKLIKKKTGKKLNFTSGKGCIKKDEHTLVAIIDGKPCVRSNVFNVFQVHELKGDVDISTGNVKFIGDIIVPGSVKEGMEIDCGNNLQIHKDVERAAIKAKGDIFIKGKIIAADILGGGEDVIKLKTINDLFMLIDILKKLFEAIEEIKKFNLLGKDRKDSEIVKVLIENKFKALPRVCINILSDIGMYTPKGQSDPLVELIRGKLLGLAIFNINHYYELEDISRLAEERLDSLQQALSIPVTVTFDYSQDSKIKSSGDIVVLGKGVIISELTANGGVYFNAEKGVLRGGYIKAKREIKAKIVGSTSGVTTKLIVEEEGHIYASIAYSNTVLKVGNREYVLDLPSKDIHAFIDSKGDLIVDKLKL